MTALQKASTMVTHSNLGKNIISNGLDVSTVVGLASGDPKALEAFGEQSGVPGPHFPLNYLMKLIS